LEAFVTRDLSIGRLSAATGVKVPTIRYYESIGLIPPAPRSASDRRLYGPNAEAGLKFIRHARDLGFSIEAVRSLLELAGEPSGSCAEINALCRKQLDGVQRKIAQLTALEAELQRMADSCAGGEVARCKVLESLSDHSLCLADDHSSLDDGE